MALNIDGRGIPFFFFFSHEKRKIPCDRRLRRLRGNMEVGKKQVEDLDVRTFNGKRLFNVHTFCSKFPQRESSFSDQFPPRIGISFLKEN
jgi:hypothetical protein